MRGPRVVFLVVDVGHIHPGVPHFVHRSVAVADPLVRIGIVRIGPMLVATGVVLMTAWMASLWFGRSLGLLAGLVLATTLEFTRYGWLAEDEIYLCGIVTSVIASDSSRGMNAVDLLRSPLPFGGSAKQVSPLVSRAQDTRSTTLVKSRLGTFTAQIDASGGHHVE